MRPLQWIMPKRALGIMFLSCALIMGMPRPVRGAFLARFWDHCCQNETGSKKQSEFGGPTPNPLLAECVVLYALWNALIEVISYRRVLSGLGNEQRKQAGHQVEGIDLPLEDKEPDSGRRLPGLTQQPQLLLACRHPLARNCRKNNVWHACRRQHYLHLA